MRRPHRAIPMTGIGLAAGLALAGCAETPKPAAKLPPTGVFVTQGPALGADGPPDRWWRLYDDPVLDRLEGEALSRNLDLKAAAASLSLAESLLDEARAARTPSTVLAGGPSYDRIPPVAGQHGPGSWTYAAGLTASYQVDLFGKVARQISAAKADAQSAEALRDALKVSIVAQTAGAYVAACGTARQLEVARNSLKLIEETYAIDEKQREVGAISEFDLARQGALRDQARALVPPLEAQHNAALFALAALTGHEPKDVPADAATCHALPKPISVLPVGDGAQMLRRRPDVRAAERNLASALARVGVARADFFPNVTFGGSVGQDTSTNGGVSGLSALSYSFGPLMTWTFPNILVTDARYRQARARARAQEAEFQQTVLTALKETETALSTYTAEIAHNKALRGARDQADEAARLARIQADTGTTSFLDLLDAQNTALAADQALAQSDQTLAADQIAVFQALGGGWK
jgi:outer membrane protein, multidrug efflux system